MSSERAADGTRWPRAEPLVTPRLRLDPLTVDDAGEMASVLADPALHRFTGGSPPSLAELSRRYARQAAGRSPDGRQGWLNWIVREAATGRAVGYVQATLEDTSEGATADLAWVIGTAWWDRGIATEAATAVAGWLREHGASTLTAHIHPEHDASMRVAERLGLTAGGDVVDGERVWTAAVSRGRP